MDKQSIINKRWDELTKKGATMMVPGEKITSGKKTGRQAIVVGVQKKLPLNQVKTQNVMPKEINGVETDVIEFHQPDILPKVLAADPYRTRRHSTLFGGISCGADVDTVTAGTAGGKVWVDGLPYGITNWHVGGMNETPIGVPMLQPGRYDGGIMPEAFSAPIAFKPPVTIGGIIPSDCPIAGAAVGTLNTLARLAGSHTRIPSPVKIQAAENLVDKCLWGPFEEDQISSLIYEIGYVDTRYWCDFAVGDKVKKSGRTSGVLFFTVKFVGAKVRVGLGGIDFADFSQQVIFSLGGEGGDSGSLILKDGSWQNNYVGALLNAGSDTDTIGNAWRNVRTVGGELD